MINSNQNLEIHSMEIKLLDELNRICKKNSLHYTLAGGSVLGAVRHSGFIPWDTDIDIIVSIDIYDDFCNILNRESPNEFIVFRNEDNKCYSQLFARFGYKSYGDSVIHIDIFPIVGAPKNRLVKKMFSFISRINYRLFHVKGYSKTVRFKNNKKKYLLAKIINIFTFFISSKLQISLHNYFASLIPVKESEELFVLCGSYGMKEYIPKEWYFDTTTKKFEELEVPVPSKWDEYLKHFYGDYMTPRKTNFLAK